MNPAGLMDEVQSLHLQMNSMSKTISSLENKINDMTELQQIEVETVQNSERSSNIIINFLDGIRELSPEELKNTVVEADAILNSVNTIPTDQNPDETLESAITEDKSKTILKNIFDYILNSLFPNTKVGEEKIQIWRKYKNKYNYIEKLKVKLPPLDEVKEVVSLQNDVNPIVQNDLNDNMQINVNDTAQNDSNNKTTYTIIDIINNRDVYEMAKSKLINSPYDDPFLKNNTINSELTLRLKNGEVFKKPISHVAPLIILKKFDESFSKPAKDMILRMHENFQSTSKVTNDSNSNNATATMTKRETRANKTKNKTNSSNTNAKTSSVKRRLTIKNDEYEENKKKKN